MRCKGEPEARKKFAGGEARLGEREPPDKPPTTFIPPRPRSGKERSPDKAFDERKNCLTKLVGESFIPADVLASLPSPEEIWKKAEVAKARAAAALANAAG